MNYYKDVLLCDEEEGYIKLEISKEDALEVLWDVYANDPSVD